MAPSIVIIPIITPIQVFSLGIVSLLHDIGTLSVVTYFTQQNSSTFFRGKQDTRSIYDWYDSNDKQEHKMIVSLWSQSSI